MLDKPSKVLRFDRFTLDLARYTLLDGNEEVALRRQSFDVLRYLAEHARQVVSRDELIKAVWAVPPARPDDSLFQCIKDIRRALGEETRRIIRSVQGRGYELAAEVSIAEAPPPAVLAALEARAEPATALETEPEPSPRLDSERRSPVAAPSPRQRTLIAA